MKWGPGLADAEPTFLGKGQPPALLLGPHEYERNQEGDVPCIGSTATFPVEAMALIEYMHPVAIKNLVRMHPPGGKLRFTDILRVKERGS